MPLYALERLENDSRWPPARRNRYERRRWVEVFRARAPSPKDFRAILTAQGIADTGRVRRIE